MKLSLIGVGKLKRDPERELVDDYFKRAGKLARGLGIRDVREIEVDAGPDAFAEADRILARMPDGARIFLLDETGENMSSREIADMVGRLRDQGTDALCFVIGGADGFTDALKARTSDKLSFGRQTWPHKMVRVMAAEQIYRALSLLAGTPYHRD